MKKQKNDKPLPTISFIGAIIPFAMFFVVATLGEMSKKEAIPLLFNTYLHGKYDWRINATPTLTLIMATVVIVSLALIYIGIWRQERKCQN